MGVRGRLPVGARPLVRDRAPEGDPSRGRRPRRQRGRRSRPTSCSARLFQHELDHLDGVLLLERLDDDQRKAGDARACATHGHGHARPRRHGLQRRRARDRTDRPVRLVYLGTPAIAVPPLRALVAAGHDIALVVTQPDKRRGRGRQRSMPSPVKAAALELGLPVTDQRRRRARRRRRPRRGRRLRALIKPHVLDAAADGQHPLLAAAALAGRGPVERAILAGDDETGVCLMAARGGPRHRCRVRLASVSPSATGRRRDELRTELVAVGTALARRRARPGLGAPTPQDGEPTYAAKIEPSELEIDWGAAGGSGRPPGARRGGRGRRSVARACWCSTDSRRATRSLPPGELDGRGGRHGRRRVPARLGAARGAQAARRRGVAQRRACAARRTPRHVSGSRATVALDALVRIETDGAYANLALPAAARPQRSRRPRSGVRDRARVRHDRACGERATGSSIVSSRSLPTCQCAQPCVSVPTSSRSSAPPRMPR